MSKRAFFHEKNHGKIYEAISTDIDLSKGNASIKHSLNDMVY